MKAEQSIVGMYAGLKPRARIKFLIKHYKDFETYRADYRDSVVSIIMAFNEYNRSNHDDLGVRVQSSGGNQDTTFNMVAEKMSVEEYFKYLEVDKDSFNDMRVLDLLNDENPLAFTKIITMVMSKDQKEKIYNFIANENEGRIPVDKFAPIFNEIMEKLSDKSEEIKN